MAARTGSTRKAKKTAKVSGTRTEESCTNITIVNNAQIICRQVAVTEATFAGCMFGFERVASKKVPRGLGWGLGLLMPKPMTSRPLPLPAPISGSMGAISNISMPVIVVKMVVAEALVALALEHDVPIVRLGRSRDGGWN